MFSRRTHLITIFLCLLLGAEPVGSAEPDAFLPLFSLIDERLSYMEDVALYKAQNRIPVEDVGREAVVLQDAARLASAEGIDAASMHEFFVAQIAAAKAIQYRYRAELLTRSAPERVIDLDDEIRPALDTLGTDIVKAFAELLRAGLSLPESARDLFAATLSSRHLTGMDKEALFNAMLRVRLSR